MAPHFDRAGVLQFAQRVKTLRREKGWSQVQLARCVTLHGFKIGQSGIGNIEAARVKQPKAIVQLAKALGVQPEILQGLRDELSPPSTPLARLRALSATGKLDRWHTCGDNAAEIGEALRLIPQVLQQLDAVATELRGAE